MVTVFVIIGIFLIMLCVSFFLLFRLYICVDWHVDQQDNYIIITCFRLRFPFYEMKMDLKEIEDFVIQNSHHLLSRNTVFSYIQSIRPLLRFEHLTFELVVGTEDPIHTAYLYPFLQAIAAPDKEHRKVSVNFQEKILQSNGQCMISVKMCHTMKVIKLLKQLQSKGD